MIYNLKRKQFTLRTTLVFLILFTKILQGGIFMSKVFVLREHALLSSRKSTLRFGDDNEIVIPLCVIDEIKATRNESFEKGRIARDLLEYINSFPVDKLMSDNGVKQENGSILRISKNFNSIEVKMENLSASEKRTLQICLGIMTKEKKMVILVTNNLSLPCPWSSRDRQAVCTERCVSGRPSRRASSALPRGLRQP